MCTRDSRSGYTAILHAAKHGHADLVEVLLRHKVLPAVLRYTIVDRPLSSSCGNAGHAVVPRDRRPHAFALCG